MPAAMTALVKVMLAPLRSRGRAEDRSRGVLAEVLHVGHGELRAVFLCDVVERAAEVQGAAATDGGQRVADVEVAGEGGILADVYRDQTIGALDVDVRLPALRWRPGTWDCT